MRTIIWNQAFLRMSAIGLFGTLALNMFALLVLEQSAAQFLAHGWWSAWFPCYVVWSVFTLTGAWEVVKGVSR